MTLIVRRKVRQSWRDAVEERAKSVSAVAARACLAAFEAVLEAGGTEAEAAYRALAEADLLIDIGSLGAGPRAEATGGPHSVPEA